MTTSKITETNWYPEKRMIVTQISGDLDVAEIERWEQSFKEALRLIDDNTTFKIFVNMFGFKAVNIGAHKRFRNIIPLTLADYGWKVGYLNLFEEEARTMTFKNIRGIRCIGAAHAHQDETKTELYETRFSRDNERFFPDPIQAQRWIENLQLSN